MSRIIGLTVAMMAAALTCIAPACVRAETGHYPSRQIKLIVPFPAGTLTDVVARAFADKLSTQLHKPVIIENKPGAGGTIGSRAVASADPDGYTLLFTNSQYGIVPSVYKNPGYDTLADFTGIALVAESPSAVIVSAKMGVTGLKQFIDRAKHQPGTIRYATLGAGSQTQLAGAYFSKQAGVKLVEVPYHDTGTCVSDLISGRTQATFAPPGFLLGQIKSGDLLALAVTSRKRMKEPIKASSVAEMAIPGYEYSTWFGFFAPARTPAPILEKVATALRKATEADDLKSKFLKFAVVTRYMPPKDFDAFVKSDIEKEAKIVKGVGIVPR